MITAGIDLSLTCTGVSILDKWAERTVYYYGSSPADTVRGTHERLRNLADSITSNVPIGALVALEGPSHNSRFGHPHDRSGLWWLVADRLYRYNCTIISVPPKCRAMYATGNGNAGKSDVMDAVRARHPSLDFFNSHDVADAVILNDMAARWGGGPVELPGDMSAKMLSAMDGIQS